MNHLVVLLHRNAEATGSLNDAGWTNPEDHLATAMGSWHLAATASLADFVLLVRGGVIADAATVFGVENSQARHQPDGQLGKRRRFITSFQIPDWLEAFLGTPLPVELVQRNPVAYGFLTNDNGVVTLTRHGALEG